MHADTTALQIPDIWIFVVFYYPKRFDKQIQLSNCGHIFLNVCITPLILRIQKFNNLMQSYNKSMHALCS